MLKPFRAALDAPGPLAPWPGGRALDPLAPVLGRIGALEVRLARSRAEIRAAQSLRYRVFYEELGARASPLQRLTRRDKDQFDRHCDHLLVIDTARGPDLAERIVGTYRLMGEAGARDAGGFYTAGEFEIEALIARHGGQRVLELGRSCVLKAYRSRRTVELLWQGIWAYVLARRIDVLFGCASLPGTDPARLALPLSFLRDHALAPEEWRVPALASRRVALGPPGPCADPRRGLASLPPLLKAYLRLGGYVGDGAVIDAQFGTTDVLVVLPVARISARHIAYYGQAEGFAA